MKKSFDTKKLVLAAMLTALVIILQLLGSFIRFGTFSITLVLIPIVIGAATCGVGIGAWLGLVFGATVLLSGDALLFLNLDPFGTVVTVLGKGFACGLCAGLVYEALESKNKLLAVFAAAFVCPLVNTGVFILGSFIFFLDDIAKWAAGEGVSTFKYIFVFLVGGNFFFELASNLLLSPAVVKLLNIRNKDKQ